MAITDEIYRKLDQQDNQSGIDHLEQPRGKAMNEMEDVFGLYQEFLESRKNK